MEKEADLSCNTEKDKVRKLHHTAGMPILGNLAAY